MSCPFTVRVGAGYWDQGQPGVRIYECGIEGFQLPDSGDILHGLLNMSDSLKKHHGNIGVYVDTRVFFPERNSRRFLSRKMLACHLICQKSGWLAGFPGDGLTSEELSALFRFDPGAGNNPGWIIVHQHHCCSDCSKDNDGVCLHSKAISRGNMSLMLEL